MSMAHPIPDFSAAHWSLPWASNLVGGELLSTTQVRSNEVNKVFRLCFDDGAYFLKIGPDLNREYQRLLWLAGRLSAPRPLGLMNQGSVDALLMSAIEGEDLAHLSASLHPQVVAARLAAALKTIHAVSIGDWPFGGTGITLVHGDACLPNFLFVDDRLSGYIDVGDMASGEPEIDLAAAVWSLQYNLGSGHGLAFLREYGLVDADEELVERLRLRYEMDSC